MHIGVNSEKHDLWWNSDELATKNSDSDYLHVSETVETWQK